MIEPWFSEAVGSRFAFLSLFALFALLEIPARRGRYRLLVMGAWNALLALSAVLIFAAVLGWTMGQPQHVTFSMGFSGFVLGSVFLGTKKEIVDAYQEAELRRTIAEDL